MDFTEINSIKQEDLSEKNKNEYTKIDANEAISSQNEAKTLTKRVIGRPFKKGQIANPLGKPVGVKSFNTLFDSAIRKIAKEEKLNLKDPEVKLITMGVLEALKGNFSFWNSLLDRRFGRPKETIDVQGGSLPIILEITRGKDKLDEGANKNPEEK